MLMRSHHFWTQEVRSIPDQKKYFPGTRVTDGKKLVQREVTYTNISQCLLGLIYTRLHNYSQQEPCAKLKFFIATENNQNAFQMFAKNNVAICTQSVFKKQQKQS